MVLVRRGLVVVLVATAAVVTLATSLPTEARSNEPTFEDRLSALQLGVTDEQETDLKIVSSIVRAMQAHDNATTLVDDSITGRIASLAARLAMERARARPSLELQRARRERNLLRDQVHTQHAQSNDATAEVDAKLKETSDRLAELHFITKTLASGADPRTAGHVAERLGGESTVHTVVERTLLHLMQCDEDSNDQDDSVVSLLELDVPWWMQELMSEALDAGTQIVVSGKERAEEVTASARSLVDSVMSQYRAAAIKLPPANKEATTAEGEGAGSEAAATANIQLATAATLGGSTLEAEVTLTNISQEALENGALRSVVHAAAPNASTAGDNSSLLEVPAVLFGRNLTASQLTAAVVQATLNEISNVKEANVTQVRAVGNDSVVVSVQCSYQGFGLLALAVNDGVLTQHLRARMANDVVAAASVHVRTKPPPPPPLSSLLSIDEGPTPIKDCEGDLCGLHRVGEIFAKMVAGAQHVQDTLQVRREKLLQPYSLDLQDLQRRLDAADARVEELERSMPNTTAAVLSFEDTIAVLREAKHSVRQQLENRDARRQAVFDGLVARQAMHDTAYDLAERIALFLNTPIAPEVARRIEEVTSAKLLAEEQSALLLSLQSRLRERRSACEASLLAADERVEGLDHNIAVMDEMMDVVVSASTPAHAQSLISHLSTTVADDVDPSLLLGLSGAESTRGRLEEAVRAIKESLLHAREDEQEQRREEKTVCDRDLSRLRKEIAQASM